MIAVQPHTLLVLSVDQLLKLTALLKNRNTFQRNERPLLQELYNYCKDVRRIVIENRKATLNGQIDLSPFCNAEYICLELIPPHLIDGLNEFSESGMLAHLKFTGYLNKISEILEVSSKIKDNRWLSLEILDLEFNNICKLDDSLLLVPKLTWIDLSHNKIQDASQLECLPNLTYVNLAFNELTSMPQLTCGIRRFPPCKVLLLKGNRLVHFKGVFISLSRSYSLGIEHLRNMEVCDLSMNAISSKNDFKLLQNLVNLREVCFAVDYLLFSQFYLARNPVAFMKDYRTHLLQSVSPISLLNPVRYIPINLSRQGYEYSLV
ncbi:serine threonine kinase 11 interacting protein [Cichlidogyrus casuarinus]|uniref:Serine threonine kinase 11 interacting protein n=1 Tax=Cichlidogyrus casuarinus TaxID=1844966 RepID=A0ABD2Q1P3_9PLAT